jgi:K+/H+ antiporter YhaU regulatory subunit KhtT
VERFGKQNQVRAVQKKLDELVRQHEHSTRQIADAVRTIIRLNERISRTNPFLNYEATVPPGSPTVGRTLAELNFWQQTGATVIAIRRGETLILSPGPYASLLAHDVIIYVGDLSCVEAVANLLRG